MGSDVSALTISNMPSYYMDEPDISPETIEILDFSLANINGHNPMKTNNLKFNKFQQVFFKKLKQLQMNDPDNSLDEYFGSRLKARRMFFVRMITILSSAVQNEMNIKMNGKWKKAARSELKTFFRDHKDLTLETYAQIGEALLHSVGECDELFTRYVSDVWATAYSLFLDQLIPIAMKAMRLQSTAYLLEEELDLSDTDSLDHSNNSADAVKPRKRSSKRHSNLRKHIANARLSKIHSLKKGISFSEITGVNPVKAVRSTPLADEELTDEDVEFLGRLSNPGKGKRRKWSLGSFDSDSDMSGYASGDSVDSNKSGGSLSAKSGGSVSAKSHAPTSTSDFLDVVTQRKRRNSGKQELVTDSPTEEVERAGELEDVVIKIA